MLEGYTFIAQQGTEFSPLAPCYCYSVPHIGFGTSPTAKNISRVGKLCDFFDGASAGHYGFVNCCGDLAASVTYEADIVSHAGEGVEAGTPVPPRERLNYDGRLSN